MGTEPKVYSVKSGVEVIQFTEETASDIVQWAKGKISHHIDNEGEQYLLRYLEDGSTQYAIIDDYVIKGNNGCFFFFSKEHFDDNYEAY